MRWLIAFAVASLVLAIGVMDVAHDRLRRDGVRRATVTVIAGAR